MSIRAKLLAICLCLTAITIATGAYSLVVQQKLSFVAVSLYDEAFLALSYLRSAQNSLVTMEAELQRRDGKRSAGVIEAALPSIIADLDVAGKRSMSPEGTRSVTELDAALTRLLEQNDHSDADAALADVEGIKEAFETAVEIFAADGYRYRGRVGALVGNLARNTWTTMGLSVAVALAVTLVGSRAIVPALRRAVVIADAVAAGRLDTPIVVRGTGETSQLLRSMATMQASIAESMAERAASRRDLELQHAWFDAALNNMTQGLCLLDADFRLIVANTRFSEMFGSLSNPVADVGIALRQAFPPEHVRSMLGDDGHDNTMPGLCDLADGRCIAVSRRPVRGGGWVITFDDVTELRQADARMVHMAHHDALTGLPNRLRFREHLQAGLADAGRNGLALLCLDLDHFKGVNDTLGHPVGDALLCAASERLLATVRKTDLVARLGGDEFAIVNEDATQPSDTVVLGTRIIDALTRPFVIDGHHIVIGASLGISFASDGPAHADALFKRADMALYQAKAEGRGRLKLFEPGMDVSVEERRQLEFDLRCAIERQELEVFYHPCISVRSGEIAGLEALLRWRHAGRGMIGPAVFIPMAEDIGLIDKLGDWVLRRACHDAAGWPVPVGVAVNLSAKQFGPTLAQDVADALADSGLEASRLELEITESLFIQDSKSALDTLHAIRSLGVRIAMDDFGTGYSSLSYFRRFPFDKVKIDQSFVRDLESKEAIAIVRAVIGLASSLGISITAEGIETEQQFTALCFEGCDEVQGYLFGKPGPADEVGQILLESSSVALVRTLRETDARVRVDIPIRDDGRRMSGATKSQNLTMPQRLTRSRSLTRSQSLAGSPNLAGSQKVAAPPDRAASEAGSHDRRRQREPVPVPLT